MVQRVIGALGFLQSRANNGSLNFVQKNSLVCLNCRYRIQQLEGRRYPHHYLFRIFNRICQWRTTNEQAKLVSEIRFLISYFRFKQHIYLPIMRKRSKRSNELALELPSACSQLYDEKTLQRVFPSRTTSKLAGLFSILSP